jgi:hypothetical protein
MVVPLTGCVFPYAVKIHEVPSSGSAPEQPADIRRRIPTNA